MLIYLYLIVHLFWAVEHIDHNAQSSPQIFSGLRLSRPSRSSRGSAHDQMKGLSESDVAAISERGDHQTSRVAQILIGVAELSVTDVSKTVLLCFIPPGV